MKAPELLANALRLLAAEWPPFFGTGSCDRIKVFAAAPVTVCRLDVLRPRRSQHLKRDSALRGFRCLDSYHDPCVPDFRRRFDIGGRVGGRIVHLAQCARQRAHVSPHSRSRRNRGRPHDRCGRQPETEPDRAAHGSSSSRPAARPFSAGRGGAIASQRKLRVLSGRIDEKRRHLVPPETLALKLGDRGIRLGLLFKPTRNNVWHFVPPCGPFSVRARWICQGGLLFSA